MDVIKALTWVSAAAPETASSPAIDTITSPAELLQQTSRHVSNQSQEAALGGSRFKPFWFILAYT